MVRRDRRRFLAALSTAAVGAAAGCVSPGTVRSGTHPITEPVTEWPSFRGDQYNTGYARGGEPTSADPEMVWTFDEADPYWGSPIVVDGTVYVGSVDGSLYALDAATGQRQWAYDTGGRLEATPAYADGVVYIGSYDKGMYAVDAASGEERWTRQLGGLIRGSPTVVDGTVYVGVGCHNLACAWYAEEADVSENGWVYALDGASGDTVWEFPVGNEVVSTPAVDEDTVYIGASDENLYALDVDSGEPVWTYEASDMVWSSPALAFDMVYVADWDGEIHAVDARSGEPVWTASPFAQYISGSVAVDEDAVYVGDTPYNSLDDPTTYFAEMYKFDRQSGDELWRFETTAIEIGSSPVVTEDRIYFGSHGQTEREGVGVYSLTTDGEQEWYIEVGGRGVGSSPALVDGRLYFSGTDGTMYAVE